MAAVTAQGQNPACRQPFKVIIPFSAGSARLCRDPLRDRAQMKTAPEAAVARYNLAREEKRALLAGRFALCGRDGTFFSERIISAGGFRAWESSGSDGRKLRAPGSFGEHP